MRFLSCLLFLIAFALPAAARPLTAEEADLLARAVENYRRVTEAKKAEEIVATIPPRVVNVVAGTAGIEASKITTALVDQTRELLKTSSISEFAIAPGPYEATDSRLADGTDVVWAVVPIQFVAEGDGRKTRNDQPLLAIFEGGTWYFSRIDGPAQQQLVGFSYPFMAEVSQPAAPQTPLN
jgi:hypothetical protein